MNRLQILLSAVSVAIFLPACDSADNHIGHDHNHAHGGHEHHQHDPAHAGHFDEHDHGHEAEGSAAHEAEGVIVLSPAAAARFGVKVDTVAEGSFSEVIPATGMVMASSGENAVVASPASGIVRLSRQAVPGTEVSAGSAIATIDAKGMTGGDANSAALAALEAAKREYERLTPLYKERLVTASEYNAARAAYEQAKAAYSPSASSGRALAPISGTITSVDVAEGQYVSVGSTIATIASARNLTLRIDVPRKYIRDLAGVENARISLDTGRGTELLDVKSLGGRRVSGPAIAQAGTSSAYVPVYFSVPNKGHALLPGSPFEAFLTGGQRAGVTSLPVEALSEQQGAFFVYKRLDEDCYEKIAVKTGARDGERVEILSGIKPGDVIVTAGTTTVRLAETSAVVPEGHSHNH